MERELDVLVSGRLIDHICDFEILVGVHVEVLEAHLLIV